MPSKRNVKGRMQHHPCLLAMLFDHGVNHHGQREELHQQHDNHLSIHCFFGAEPFFAMFTWKQLAKNGWLDLGHQIMTVHLLWAFSWLK
eukprot:6333530-Ditylum_brightwellii.AAC.1